MPSNNAFAALPRMQACVCFVSAIFSVLAVGGASAQGYPSRPMRMIVPFPPGGSTDTYARILGPRLAASVGQQVVIDNRPGAGGALGAELAAKAPADGYTIWLGQTANLAIGPVLRGNSQYDPVRDFAPLTLVQRAPSVLVVSAGSPVKSLQDLIAMAKKNPQGVIYGSAGVGTTGHLNGHLVNLAAGIHMTHVPYKGAAPAIQDVLAGHVDVMFDNMSSAIANLKAGRVRALGVAALARYPALPDLATVAEQGVPGYETTIWIALFAPAATPPVTLANLQHAVAQAVQSPEYRERLAAIDMQPRSSTPAELAGYLRSELAKWGKVVKDAGIKPDQ
jgi:tripartite-type tricarboxylate transporter receptor subunit TctC